MAHRNDQSTHKLRGVDRPLGKKRRVKKEIGAPPANTELIAPGADLPAPRQKKPHELEAEKPEDYADHEVTVPMLDFDGSEGKGTVRGRIQKKVNLAREAEIVERIREVAILCKPEDAARLLPRALDLANKLKTQYALAEARAYISMLAHKEDAADSAVDKRRVYLKPGQHAPPGHAEREGKLGGRYYEVGTREERHEPSSRIDHIGEAPAGVFEFSDKAVGVAQREGWEPQVKQVRAHTEAEWERQYHGTEGKRVSKAAPYAHYVFDERHLGLSPRCARDIGLVLKGATNWSARYGIQAMAHEIIHASHTPIRGWAYRGANAQIEEAITEWLTPDLYTSIATEVFGWQGRIAHTVPTSYWDECQSLEQVAGVVADVIWPYHRSRIRDTIMRWKKDIDPNDRSEIIRREVVTGFLKQDHDQLDPVALGKVMGMNSTYCNWSDFWKAKGQAHRKSVLEKMGMDVFKAYRTLLGEGVPKDVPKRGTRSKMSTEEIRTKARERVKAWRARLKEEGRREKRTKKDFGAAPPADAMIGEDVHNDAIGSGGRRKKKRQGIFEEEEKQLATGSVSSEDMGPMHILEVPDSACSKGACEIFASSYGSEILTEAVPQDINPAYGNISVLYKACLLYTSPSPRDATLSRMPSSA